MFATAKSYVPQCGARAESRRGPLFVWIIVAIIALIPPSLIVAAPLLLARGHAASALLIYEVFGKFCHQLAERSLHLEGQQLAVCSRCTGLYFGFALSVLFYPLARSLKRVDTPRLWWLLLATIPVVVDWSLGVTGLWDNTHLSRFLTGALFGAAAAVYVVPGLVDLGQSIRRRLEARPREDDDKLVFAAERSVSPGHTAPSDYSSPSSRI